MSISSHVLSVLFSLPIAFSALADPSFITPGSVVDGDIADVRFDGTWFAVHQKGGGWHLSKTTVTVKKDGNGESDIRSAHPKTVGLLRDMELTEGPLEAAQMIVGTDGIADGKSRAFRFKGQRYSLVVQPVPYKYHSEYHNKTFDNIRNDVYFSDGKVRTRVYGDAKTGQSCERPFINWAGDIDRDGKPDFIAYFSDDSQHNGSICVLLSSGAPHGRLVKKPVCN